MCGGLSSTGTEQRLLSLRAKGNSCENLHNNKYKIFFLLEHLPCAMPYGECFCAFLQLAFSFSRKPVRFMWGTHSAQEGPQAQTRESPGLEHRGTGVGVQVLCSSSNNTDYSLFYNSLPGRTLGKST